MSANVGNSDSQLQQRAATDELFWAESATDLRVRDIPAGALNLNVDGRIAIGPIQGFGRMWQKSYRVRLAGISDTPTNVVREWKTHFPSFWPPGNHFYGPLTGIEPGDVALINLALPARAKLSTGVLVLYADDESFTLMTPQGHMFAGWITFSAFLDRDTTVAQVQVLMRANDPLYELGMAFGGHRKEDRFWEHTVSMLARHLGVASPEVDTKITCVDSRRQWRRAGNVWHNASIRTGLYLAAAPAWWSVRATRRLFARLSDPSH